MLGRFKINNITPKLTTNLEKKPTLKMKRKVILEKHKNLHNKIYNI